ncbi:PilZ domain-containing protein [Nitrosophilus kaiyonis]|uniref:PilZ domain-containing protein n=1 Tax=Nitrosophilus kaiyonis TaxID=2930200 RepID=UPI002492C8F8|nr:PilZ domain-containing protein [Nitrosophilus kaiyonis]
MKNINIKQLAKEFKLNEKEQNLLKNILIIKDFHNNIKDIKVFENYINKWLEKIPTIKEEDERLLKSIREKFHFFESKFPLYNTKYIKINQKAYILNSNKIEIALYKNSEKKLFWKISPKFINHFKPNDIIKLGFLRKEDGKFYLFKTKILNIQNISGMTLLTTMHSEKFEIRQKRKNDRYPIEIPLEIKYKNIYKKTSTFIGNFSNISKNGAQIFLKNFDSEIDKAEPLSLKFSMDQKIFFVEANIKYIIKENQKIVIGIEFKNIKKDFESSISKFINQLSQKNDI